MAGIRVMSHLNNCSPNPEQLADFLNLPDGSVRIKSAFLVELGALVKVESAFESHLEVGDPTAINTLSDDDGPSITEDLDAFDKKKQEEAHRMAHLFDSGEHEDEKQRKLGQMDDELRDYKKKKPINPFGEN
jgi:hypothetical protein